MISSSARPDWSMTSAYSRCSGERPVSRRSRVIPMTPFIGVRISWLMFATNSDLSREDSRAAWRARTRTSMLCTASTTPATVRRRRARVQGPAQEDACAVLALERVLGLAHHLAGEGPLEHPPVPYRHPGPGLVDRATHHRGVGGLQVAQPAGAVREVAALAVEHGHGHRRVVTICPQLLALALDRLLHELALR